MECEICFEQYDREAHCPTTILPCTHVYCHECLTKMKRCSSVVAFKCPKCEVNITKEVPSYALINILDQASTTNKKNSSKTTSAMRLKREQKLKENQIKFELLKASIKKKTNDLIEKLLNDQEKLIRELEIQCNDLNSSIEKAQNETELENTSCELELEISCYFVQPNENSIGKILANKKNTQTKAGAVKNKVLISGSWDKTIKYWDINTGECLRTLKGHTSPVESIKVGSDNFLISSSGDHTIKVWNIKTGDCRQTLANHPNWFNRFEFINNDILIGVCSNDEKLIRVWNFKTGKCIRSLVGHTDSVWSLKVLSNLNSFLDSVVVTGSKNNIIKLWNYETGECISTFEGHSARISCFELVQF